MSHPSRFVHLVPAFAATLAFLLAACTETPLEAPPETPAPALTIEGPLWILQAIETPDDTVTITGRTDYRFRLVENGRIWLQLACNTGDGPYSANDSSMSVYWLSTKMGCMDDPHSESFQQVLPNNGPIPYQIMGDTLRVSDGNKVLRFIAMVSQEHWTWTFPALDLRCDAGTIPCAFDFVVNRENLSDESKRRIALFEADSNYLSVTLARFRPEAFTDSSLIFNFAKDTILIHFGRMSATSTNAVYWTGVAEGRLYGDASLFVRPNSVSGNVRVQDAYYMLVPLDPGFHMILDLDLSRTLMED